MRGWYIVGYWDILRFKGVHYGRKMRIVGYVRIILIVTFCGWKRIRPKYL